MIQVDLLPPIKLNTDMKVSQVIPFLQDIAERSNSDLNLFFDKDMRLAFNEFKMILIICEQYVNKNGEHQPLRYWIKREWEIANRVYNNTCGRNCSCSKN